MNIGKNKAITLIALIITIIIVLILVSFGLNMILSNNGILNKAKLAQENTNYSTGQELSKLDSYNQILENYSTSRGDTVIAIGDKNKLNCTITNMTGTTFTINVNSVDASTTTTMYYFINNILVYQGTDTSYTVTGLQENTQYEVFVLGDKNNLKVTTGTGDSIASWLACIGETRDLTLDQIVDDTQLVTNLFSSTSANNYLNSSTQIIIPGIFNNEINCNKILSNTTNAKLAMENTVLMSYICQYSIARLSMYNNYSVTEPIIVNSTNIQNVMKASAQYQVVNVTPANSNTAFSTAYNGKAFVFQTWNYNNSSYTDYRYHGNYLNGGTIKIQTNAGTTQYITANKFAQTVISGYAGYSAQVCYTSIFKI